MVEFNSAAGTLLERKSPNMLNVVFDAIRIRPQAHN